MRFGVFLEGFEEGWVEGGFAAVGGGGDRFDAGLFEAEVGMGDLREVASFGLGGEGRGPASLLASAPFVARE